MTIAELKVRLLRAFDRATAAHPGDEIPELRTAIEALPSVHLLGRLAPEMRLPIERELHNCTDYQHP